MSQKGKFTQKYVIMHVSRWKKKNIQISKNLK